MKQIPARVILAILAFFLFFVAQMSRVNINIAIIAMEDKYFNNGWDAKVIVLGAFYWCYSLIELPGTFIVRRYGCRKILLLSVLFAGIGNFLFPYAYLQHPILGAIIRALQGLTLGITWPAVAVLSSKWIPIHERSKFVSTYQGSSVGTSFTNAVGGLIIHTFDWTALFYLTGILSILWTITWWIFGYDTPFDHPRISQTEKTYLESTIGKQQVKKTKIPWFEMFKSKAVWAVIIGGIGIMWYVITISMQLPPYLQQVHKIDIRTSGLLLAIPDLCAFIFSFSYSIFTDRIIKNGIMTVTNARKLAFVFSHVIPAFLLIILGIYGNNNLTMAMTIIICAVALGGATSSGNLANVIDISPNNAGIIMGILKTFCIFPGILSPIIVKQFTSNDPLNWLPVFAITSIILVITTIVYCLMGTGEIQSWNQKVDNDDIKEIKVNEERNLLKKENEIEILTKKTELKT